MFYSRIKLYDDGGEKAATDETTIISLTSFNHPERNILVIAITEIPKTLINFSSSSIEVS